jgi:hypothetical protein
LSAVTITYLSPERIHYIRVKTSSLLNLAYLARYLSKPINRAFVRPDDILVLEKDKDVLFVGLSKLSDIITFKTGIENRAACHDWLIALQYSLAAL